MARKVNQNRKEKTLKTQLSCNYEYFISVKTIGRQWLSEFFTDDYLNSALHPFDIDCKLPIC